MNVFSNLSDLIFRNTTNSISYFSSAQEGKVEVFTLCYTMVEMYLSYKRMFIVSGC